MTNNDLIVEKVWSLPEWSAHFLQRCVIYLQIRNKAGRPIQIERVKCHFELDHGLGNYVPDITHRLTLDHNCLCDPIPIHFEVDPSLKSLTNRYRLTIYYRLDGQKTIEHDSGKHFVFVPLGRGKQFFISHKDPEDTNRARILKRFLGKLGFNGYLAEDDLQPGVDMWETKIPAEIERSAGVIILWTKNAARNPKSIHREIKLAKQKRKHMVLALDYMIRRPTGFPRNTEYYRFESPISPEELKKLACCIEETDRRGGYA